MVEILLHVILEKEDAREEENKIAVEGEKIKIVPWGQQREIGKI